MTMEEIFKVPNDEILAHEQTSYTKYTKSSSNTTNSQIRDTAASFIS